MIYDIWYLFVCRSRTCTTVLYMYILFIDPILQRKYRAMLHRTEVAESNLNRWPAPQNWTNVGREMKWSMAIDRIFWMYSTDFNRFLVLKPQLLPWVFISGGLWDFACMLLSRPRSTKPRKKNLKPVQLIMNLTKEPVNADDEESPEWCWRRCSQMFSPQLGALRRWFWLLP